LGHCVYVPLWENLVLLAHSIRRFHNSNGISIGSTVFAVFTNVSNTETESVSVLTLEIQRYICSLH